MNISSILITIVGIIIILVLYVASRVGQNNLSNKELPDLPDIKDENGQVFTSILDDIPASDETIPNTVIEKSEQTPNHKQQIVLFISGKEEEILDGTLIQQTLLKNNLKLGDKDIYHYYIESDNQLNSLFRVANGVAPWTLTEEDLIDKKIVGISLVMLLPNAIENKQAITLFMQMADIITNQVKGVLKNQQQEILSAQDRKNIIN